jgi:hypothetical protein
MRAQMADAIVQAHFIRAARIAGQGIKHMIGGSDGIRIGDRRMGEGDAGPDAGDAKTGD